jgi:hypothetical protein
VIEYRREARFRKETAMSELTLESLAKRVEALEAALAAERSNRLRNDWRKVEGMFHDSESDVVLMS